MAIAFVQELKAGEGTSGTSQAYTLAATATAGNTVILCASARETSLVSNSVTDSRGNTWVIDLQVNGSNDFMLVASTQQDVGTLQSGDTVTLHLGTASTTNISYWIEEFSGVLVSASRVDKTNSATSAAVTSGPTGTTAATTQAAEMALAMISIGTGTTTPTVSKDAAYSAFTTAQQTNASTTANSKTGWPTYKILAATGTQAATYTWTGAGISYQGGIVTYLAASASAPSNSVAPAVTGTAKVGSLLTTDNGTWTDDGSPTFTYQWQRGGVNIGSATSSTYTLVDADDATNMRCVVTDTDSHGATSANSNATAITEPVPTNSVAPVASGAVSVGSVVSATTGTWTHQAGTIATYAYQWQDSADGSAGWANISGKTSSTYTVEVGELTKFLRCNVTGTNSGGAGSAASSNVLGAVVAASSTSNLALSGSGEAFLRMKGLL